MATVEFWFDPICPFAWIASRWVETVAVQRRLDVQWRFIALRFLNEGRDYATEFPPGYEELHRQGLAMLRVAAAVREQYGDEGVGRLYTELGRSIWDCPPGTGMARVATGEHLRSTLASAGLPVELAISASSDGHDPVIRSETESALERVGPLLGTPVIAVDPPDGPAFFGPVISRIPAASEAGELWDAVWRLATWPGFAELKRSLREWPQLRSITPSGTS